jgi:hypothetical protein
VLLEERNLRVVRNRSEQRTLDLLARAIFRVHDSSSAVAPLQAQIKILRITAPIRVGKRSAHLREASNQTRAFAHHELDHVSSAQASPRFEGVGHVQI